MDNGYSLSDIAAISNNEGFGGTNAWVLIILFALIFGNGGLFGPRTDGYSQFATAASQNEILSGQKFSDLDNKIDRGFTSIGNGIADLGYAIANQTNGLQTNLGGAIVNEGRAIQTQLANCCCENQKNVDSVRYDMAMNTQKILDSLAQNKIESLQNQVNQLQLSQAMCGVPKINPYMYGVYSYNNGCGCTGNI